MAKKRKAKGTKAGDGGGMRPSLTETRIDHLVESIELAMLGGDEARARELLEGLGRAERSLPGVLTRRLIDGRARIPMLAFDLIEAIAGEKAVTYLDRIAADPNAADIVRFGAHRRAGWAEADQEEADPSLAQDEAEARLAFLATLRDPDGTLILALAQSSDWPPRVEVLEEVLGYLKALPDERQRALLSRASAELGQAAAWVLQAALHLDTPSVQRLALAELLRLHAPGAVGALRRLERTAADPELRAEAGTAARRLGIRVVDQAPPSPLPMPSLDRALLSIIDNDGGQVVIVVRQIAEGLVLFADLFINDQVGIKSAFGRSHTPPDFVDEILDDLVEEGGVDLVEVDLAAVRGALAAALEVNATHGYPLPPEFEVWEPFVHESYPPAADEPIVVPKLDDAPYAGRDDLVARGDELLDHAFFDVWSFGIEATAAAMLRAPLPARSEWTERQYRPLIEHLVPPSVVAQLRDRLRRQAWLLEQRGDVEARDLALATAAYLAAPSRAGLVKLPFLRRLVEIGVSDLANLFAHGPG